MLCCIIALSGPSQPLSQLLWRSSSDADVRAIGSELVQAQPHAKTGRGERCSVIFKGWNIGPNVSGKWLYNLFERGRLRNPVSLCRPAVQGAWRSKYPLQNKNRLNLGQAGTHG